MSSKFDSVDQRVYWGYRIMGESPVAESVRKHLPCKDESGPLGSYTMKGPPPQLHTEVASGTPGLLTLTSFLRFSRFLGVLWAPSYLKEGIFQPGENTYKIDYHTTPFLNSNIYLILCVWVFACRYVCIPCACISLVWSCWWLGGAVSVLNLNHSASLSF